MLKGDKRNFLDSLIAEASANTIDEPHLPASETSTVYVIDGMALIHIPISLCISHIVLVNVVMHALL